MRGSQILDPRLVGGAGFSTAFVTVTNAESPYTIAAFDELVWITSAGGAVTINLPPVASSFRRVLMFAVADSTNTITLDPDGTEQIDGAASKTITAGLVIVCNGSEWRTVASG